MAVNGVVYDNESLEIEIPGVGQSLTLSKVNYKLKKPVKIPTGLNNLPRGQIRGKFEGTFDATVARNEFDTLNEGVSDTGVLGAEPLPVTLTYGADGDEPVTDELEVKADDFDFSIEEEGEAVVKIMGKLTRIPILNGVPAYIDPLGRSE